MWTQRTSHHQLEWLRGVIGRRAVVVALLLALAGGGFLRCYRLGEPAVFTDEAFSWRVSRLPPRDLLRAAARDTHPPAHFLLLKCWANRVGDSPIALRSLSALLGVLGVIAAYSLGSALEGRCTKPAIEGYRASAGRWSAVGLLAASLVAINPLQITHSRIARMYGMGSLLTAVTTICLVKGLCGSRFWLWAYLPSAVLLCYTHNFGLPVVAMQLAAAVAVAAKRPNRGRLRATLPFLVLAAVTAILYAPWFAVLRDQAVRVKRDFWISPASLDDAVREFCAWSTGTPSPSTAEAWLWSLALVSLLVGVLVKYGGAGLGEADLIVVATAASGWLMIAASEWLWRRPLLEGRYLAFSQPPALVVLARILLLPRQWAVRTILVVLVALPSAAAAWQDMRTLPKGTPSIEAAMTRLAAAYRPGDLVVVAHAGLVNCARYYAHRLGFPQPVSIACPISMRIAGGHINHLAALGAEVTLMEGELATWPLRVFELRENGLPTGARIPAGYRLVDTWGEPATLQPREMGGGHYEYRVMVYEQLGGAP